MARERPGRRVVAVGYVVLVAVAGGLGYLIGLLNPADLRAVRVLGLWTVRPTPAGLALYGSVTVGTVLGVGLALVALAARYDDRRPR